MTVGTVTQLGNLASYAEWFSSPFFVWGCSLVSLIVGNDWLEGKIGAVHTLYIGISMTLLIEMCSAAYIVYKLVQSTVDISVLVASGYRLTSIAGNLLPYYEFGYFALYNFTAFGVIVMAFFGSIQMWELVEEREVGAAEGFLGRAISWGDAIKFMALGTAVIVTTYYAAYAIGETLDQSIEWFSTRDSRAEQANGCSGSNSGANCDNTPGASLQTDLNLHTITVVYSWFVNSFIIFVAHWTAQRFIKINELEDCDLDGVDESYYSDVRTLIAQQVDLASCKNTVK